MNINSIGKRFLDNNSKALKLFSVVYSFFSLNRYCVFGRHNKIDKDYAFLNRCYFKINGSNNKVIFHGTCRFKKCRFIINGNNNIFHFYSVSANDVEFYSENSNNKLIIGNKTNLCGKAHIALIEGTKIEFGENCLLSSEIIFRTGDSHSVLDLEGKRINPSKDVIIGNHVWIGNRVLINKGVHIPDNCIIGNGSVVTRKFDQNNVVIAGNPAKIVKENINWDSARI